MKRDLKSMAKNRGNAENNVKNNAKKQGLSQDELKRQTQELSQLSEGELYEQLFKNAREAKEKGELSGSDIDGFLSMVSPMLNEEQRRRLTELAEKIR